MKKYLFYPIVFICLIATGSFAQDAPPAPAAPKPHNVSFGVMGTAEEALDLGVNSFIFRLNWDDIEPEKGKYELKAFDEIIKKIGKKEMNVTCVLTGSTLWNSSAEKIDDEKKWTFYPPKQEFYPALADTVSMLAEKYGEKIKYWGVWYQPDAEGQWLPKPDTKTYTAMLGVCMEALGKVTTGAKLIAGPFKEGLVQDGDTLKKSEFVAAVNGKKAFSDLGGTVFSAVTVDGEDGMDSYNMSAQMGNSSNSMPVLGVRFASKDKNGKTVKFDQEGNLLKAYIMAFAGGASVLYCPVSEPAGSDESESVGLAAGASKRPAYGAFKSIVKEFDGLEYQSPAPCAEQKIKAFIFKKKDADFVMVVWTDKEFVNQFKDKKAYVSIGFQYPDNVKTVNTRTIDKPKETLKQRNGFCSFAVSDEPLLVDINTTSIDLVMGQVDRFDPDYQPAWTQKNVIVNPGKWKPPAGKPGKPGGGLKPGGGKPGGGKPGGGKK
ncbi:MAG: hypothetical protein HZA48_10825 [Planctomycetes bacterium]|nr:hypothetical protein [Planctomycetota bacterium]